MNAGRSMMGLDQYMEYARTHWSIIPWWLWPLLTALFLVGDYYYLRGRRTK